MGNDRDVDPRRFQHYTYLTRAQLVRRPWRETRPGWDHDHCEFCFVKFSADEQSAELREGWCTLDEYHWICDDCVHDLDDAYEFAFLTEPRIPTVQEIRVRYEITTQPSPGTKPGRSLMAYDGSGRERE